MIATFAIVSGCLGIRLRTYCRIRHRHKCDSIYNLRLRKFAPCKGAFRNCKAISSLCGSRQIRLQAAALGSMQSRNTQSIKRSFVRWVYFALKRRGLVSVVRFCHYTLIRLSPLPPYTGAWHAPVLHTEEKNLPSKAPVHSHLFQILLPCLFSFFLSWSSLIFCV